jgi:hypothetical protein
MKKTKQCLKCDSLKVVWYATPGERHHNDTVTYLCVDCGFYEEYRRYPADLVAHHESEKAFSDRFGWVNPKPGKQGPYR